MTLWSVVESPPAVFPKPPPHSQDIRDNPGWGTDFGLMAPPRDQLPAGDDIVGTRPYGKNPKTDHSGDLRVYRYPQKRLAYCAIRAWAIKKKYIDPSQDASLRNRCPKPR
jgi:hypothetical protein